MTARIVEHFYASTTKVILLVPPNIGGRISKPGMQGGVVLYSVIPSEVSTRKRPGRVLDDFARRPVCRWRHMTILGLKKKKRRRRRGGSPDVDCWHYQRTDEITLACHSLHDDRPRKSRVLTMGHRYPADQLTMVFSVEGLLPRLKSIEAVERKGLRKHPLGPGPRTMDIIYTLATNAIKVRGKRCLYMGAFPTMSMLFEFDRR
ncbi:hypothetical protein BDY19DRAFT_909875 [Irpex rosettiformis]|uniref:Uncharacterized protein n=1 Tax=Irpex rosettiformis TaxID=378272 RepID=A0ACB8TRE7_9APHY|nr:hypothetical protein BDY19DRAFT_909875 [Irpex rosettiformis]